jgi:hypothetical protein
MYPRVIFVPHSHRGSRHDVRDPYQVCLTPFSQGIFSTNGLKSRSRKWLLAITIFAFALSTMYWILSVVFTFLLVDSFNNSIAACFGSDNATVCLTHEIAASVGKLPAAVLLSMFDDVLLINVSTVQYRVPASCPRVTRKDPCELTRLPEC